MPFKISNKNFISKIFPILALSLCLACKKDNISENNNDLLSYDTIFPAYYLPAYPGSYWIYNNGDTIKTGNEYKLFTIYEPHTLPPYNELDTCISIDTAYFPMYNNFVLKKYTLYNNNDLSCSEYRLLDEEEGNGWTLNITKMDWSRLYVQKKDTSIILPNNQKYDSVIIMNYRYTIQNNDITKCEYYYAKNVGYIGSKIIYDQLSMTDSIKWGNYLIEYKINK